MKATRLKHKFVDEIPEELSLGHLYISINYATASHLCCCGCGQEVVTPISPTDWKCALTGLPYRYGLLSATGGFLAVRIIGLRKGACDGRLQ
jgi:hypothetical protein